MYIASGIFKKTIVTDIMCELMYYVYSDNICEGEAILQKSTLINDTEWRVII